MPLSGGVDSSVVAAMLIKAIGQQLVCVHVNHGLMRKNESESVVEVFQNQLHAKPDLCGCHGAFPRQAGRRCGSGTEEKDYRRRVYPCI